MMHEQTQGRDLPVPAGTLALAFANLLQSSGDSIRIMEHSPEDPDKPLVEKMDEVASVQDDAAALTSIIHRIRSWESALIICGIVLATAAGVLAAAGSLGTEEKQPVNIFWLLAAVLGGQTILLAAWFVLALIGGRFLRRFSMGGMLIGTARFLATRLNFGSGRKAGERHRLVGAASVAIATADFGGVRARWALGSVSHLAWTAFNSGLLVSLLVILSIQQFDFGWETTIGSDEFFEEAAEFVSKAPQAIGFDVPTTEEFARARIDPTTGSLEGTGDEARRAFSGLLIGSVVLYGLAPRILLFLACFVLWRHSRRRWKPDFDAARFAPMRRMTEPHAVHVDRESVDRGDEDSTETEARGTEERRTEGSAIVGIELDTPSCGWPPPCGAPVEDLGVLESREDRAAIARRLSIAAVRPARLIVFANIATTPDRGVLRSMRQVHTAADSPTLRVVLTGGGAFRERVDAGALERRVLDWKELVKELGTSGRLEELDLDNLTATTRARLSELVGGSGRPELPRDRGILGVIDAAFAEIGVHARRWPGAPTDQDRLALHKAVASCAGADTGLMIKGFPSPSELAKDPKLAIETAASRILDLLPGRLASSTRWAAIGSLVGAFACVTAAGTVAPAVLAALPVWMASGAVSAGTIAALKKTPAGEEEEQDDLDQAAGRGDAIAAAALHAVVLAMQGRGERFIQETLDRVFCEEPGALADQDEVGQALGRWRTRIARVLEERSA